MGCNDRDDLTFEELEREELARKKRQQEKYDCMAEIICAVQDRNPEALEWAFERALSVFGAFRRF
jgi:hypothetical protein